MTFLNSGSNWAGPVSKRTVFFGDRGFSGDLSRMKNGILGLLLKGTSTSTTSDAYDSYMYTRVKCNDFQGYMSGNSRTTMSC